jgi:hypothetical protein
MQNNGATWVSEPRTADIIVLFEEWDSRFWHYSDDVSLTMSTLKFSDSPPQWMLIERTAKIK